MDIFNPLSITTQTRPMMEKFHVTIEAQRTNSGINDRIQRKKSLTPKRAFL